MKAKRTMHVLTDKGRDRGRRLLTPGRDHKGKPVHIRIEPMKGQSLKEVAVPAELARLDRGLLQPVDVRVSSATRQEGTGAESRKR